MIDFFASITIAVISIMTLVILYSNFRQARAFREVKQVLEEWYQATMRDRKESHQDEIKIEDPIAWFSKQAGLKLIELHRVVDTPPAVEFISGENKLLVVSTQDPDTIKKVVRSLRRKTGRASRLVEPLLGKTLRKVTSFEKYAGKTEEWFGVEAEIALKALGVDWGEIESLWFYVVPVETTKEKPRIKFELKDLQNWWKSLYIGLRKWLRNLFSKASS